MMDQLAQRQFVLQQDAACGGGQIQKVSNAQDWSALKADISATCGAVVFWRGPRCGGSRSLAVPFYEFAKANAGASIVFGEVDVECCPVAASEQSVLETPTF